MKIAKLSEDNREFDFFLCPNIFIRTKGNLDNYERNICASNCYFVDIDEVHTDKPIYNCSEEEIKEDLEKWFVLHKMDMVGKRHYFFVIYSIVLRELGWSMEAIENRCFSMNQSLPDRLPESELLKHITQRHKYRFRNETIADWLNFTQSEMATFKCNYSEEDMLEHRREKS